MLEYFQIPIIAGFSTSQKWRASDSFEASMLIFFFNFDTEQFSIPLLNRVYLIVQNRREIIIKITELQK